MLRYAITDRRMFPGDEEERRAALLRQAVRLAHAGVEYLQVREKDLPDGERIALASAVQVAIRAAGGTTRVLLNGPHALALAAEVDGAHLTSSLLRADVSSGLHVEGRRLLVSVSCHTLEEVALARGIADLILFGPVYEKRVAGQLVTPGTGLQRLREACHAAFPVPVLALGGVTETSALACRDAGAAGFASIRGFV